MNIIWNKPRNSNYKLVRWVYYYNWSELICCHSSPWDNETMSVVGSQRTHMNQRQNVYFSLVSAVNWSHTHLMYFMSVMIHSRVCTSHVCVGFGSPPQRQRWAGEPGEDVIVWRFIFHFFSLCHGRDTCPSFYLIMSGLLVLACSSYLSQLTVTWLQLVRTVKSLLLLPGFWQTLAASNSPTDWPLIIGSQWNKDLIMNSFLTLYHQVHI